MRLAKNGQRLAVQNGLDKIQGKLVEEKGEGFGGWIGKKKGIGSWSGGSQTQVLRFFLGLSQQKEEKGKECRGGLSTR